MGLATGELIKACSTIGAVVQSGQGTPGSPATGDVFRAYDVDVVPVPEIFIRENQVGVMGHPVSPAPGQLYRQLTFKHLIAGWGTSFADAPCNIDAALRACKLANTIDSTNQTHQYDPITSGEEWTTFGIWWDGVKHLLTDAQGNLKISGVVGEPLIAEFSFMGLWNDLSDTALITGNALHTTMPPTFKNATFQLGSDTLPISAFEIDMGNVITPLQDPNSTQGVRSFVIVNRAVTGSFDPEMTLVATHDYEATFTGGTPAALTIELDGGTGNKITIYAPKVQFTGLTPGDRGEVRTYDIPFNLAYDSGDDEFYLKYSHS